MLDVPIENSNDSVLFPGSDVPWSSVAHTLDPQDKFVAPRPAPLPPTRHSNTATHEVFEQLKSPIPPLTGLSVEPMITHERGEHFGCELQNQCATYEQNITRATSVIENTIPPVKTPMEAHSFPMVKSRSCPEVFTSTPGPTIDLEKGISDVHYLEDCRPTISHGGSMDVYLGMSSLQSHGGTSSSDNTGYRSFLLEVDDSLSESTMQRPLTDPDHFLQESDQSMFCFNSWSGDRQNTRRPNALTRQYQSQLALDVGLSDTSSLPSRRGYVSESSDIAIVMLEEDNPLSIRNMQHDRTDVIESANSFGANCQNSSMMIPQLIDLPSPCCSISTMQPPSPPRAQFLQLERPGLIRSKFSEWSVTSVDAPHSESDLAPEVEDIQSPTMSAVSYSSDGIVTPRKQSEQTLTSERFNENDDFYWPREECERERSYESEISLADMVTSLRLADETYALRYNAWHTANADAASAGSGAGNTFKDDLSADCHDVENIRHGHDEGPVCDMVSKERGLGFLDAAAT